MNLSERAMHTGWVWSLKFQQNTVSLFSPPFTKPCGGGGAGVQPPPPNTHTHAQIACNARSFIFAVKFRLMHVLFYLLCVRLNSYVIVFYFYFPYVTRMFRKVFVCYLLSIRLSPVYISVCYSYVSRMYPYVPVCSIYYSYVTRMLLVLLVWCFSDDRSSKRLKC